MSTDVALSRATRDSVTSLRAAIDQAAVAGQRLSTGKKVNSALEDPTIFFTSTSLSDRAAELDRTVEQVSQGTQVVAAANDGLTAITKLFESAKALVNRAAESLSAFDRASFAASYNEVLQQIEDLAGDSGYRGRNLLAGEGQDLKLYFGDQRVDAVTIEAVDYTNIEATLGLVRVEEGTIAKIEVQLSSGGTPLKASDLVANDDGDIAVGDVIEVRNSAGEVVSSLTIKADTKVSDLVRALTVPSAGVRASVDDSGVLKIEAAADATISGGSAGGALENVSLDAEPSGWFEISVTEATITTLKSGTETLRLQAVTFGTNLTMLQNRERFMKEFSGTLLTGSERLVAADPDEEGANLLALQLRQQFASNALSFSNEADQGVLRLLGG